MIYNGLKVRVAWAATLPSITLEAITGRLGPFGCLLKAKAPRLCKGAAECFLAKRGKAAGLWPLSRELEAQEPPILALEA